VKAIFENLKVPIPSKICNLDEAGSSKVNGPLKIICANNTVIGKCDTRGER
jgi:hypothetical protein